MYLSQVLIDGDATSRRTEVWVAHLAKRAIVIKDLGLRWYI